MDTKSRASGRSTERWRKSYQQTFGQIDKFYGIRGNLTYCKSGLVQRVLRHCIWRHGDIVAAKTRILEFIAMDLDQKVILSKGYLPQSLRSAKVMSSS